MSDKWCPSVSVEIQMGKAERGKREDKDFNLSIAWVEEGTLTAVSQKDVPKVGLTQTMGTQTPNGQSYNSLFLGTRASVCEGPEFP
jgi:hypothetical protein